MKSIRAAAGRWTWGLLALPLAVAVVVAFSVMTDGNGTDQAAAQESFVEFSIEVDGGLNACSTSPGGTTKCEVALSNQFTVGVNLDSFAGPGDAYGGIQVRLEYSGGLTLNNRPNVSEIADVWPDCVFDVENKGVAPNTYLVACAVGLPTTESLSTYTGRVVEVDFTCTDVVSQETVTMVHGDLLETNLVFLSGNAVPDADGIETLTINCVEAPPTPTPTPTPPASVEFSIEVDRGFNPCSTSPGGTTKCEVALNNQFTVGVNLDSFAVPGDGYGAIQVRIEYSGGLTLNNRPNVSEISGVWPDCVFVAENKNVAPNTYLFGCAVGIQQVSTYTGRVAEVDFTCTDVVTQETVTMVHGDLLETFLAFQSGSPPAVDADGSETLTISCVDAPPPQTPTPTPPPFPWDVDGDGSVTTLDIFEVASHFGETRP